MWGTGGVYTILGTNDRMNGAPLKFCHLHICCLALMVDFLSTQWSFTFAPYIYPNCVKAGSGILGEEVVSSRRVHLVQERLSLTRLLHLTLGPSLGLWKI